MAQTGYTPILIYSSSTTTNAPAVGNLTNSTLGSELAINIADGKLFYKDNANAIQVIAWKTTPTTAGGTGLTSYTAGDMLYYASGTTLTQLAIGVAGRWLGSSGTAPQWNAPAALTKTDDTNVTLTLGGSASTALLNAASLTLGWTGQLAVTRGGTGLSTVAQGDILYGSASNTLSALAKNTTATRYLSNTGTSNNPAWAQVDLTNGVTGILPSANGGTANGFTKFSGPATSEKTFTLPNSSVSIDYLTRAGNVLQVVEGRLASGTTTTSTTYVDTGLNVSITPSSASNKIVVIAFANGILNDNTHAIAFQLVRGSTSIAITQWAGASRVDGSITFSLLDTPATTSSTSYKVQFRTTNAATTAYISNSNVVCTIVAMEIAV